MSADASRSEDILVQNQLNQGDEVVPRTIPNNRIMNVIRFSTSLNEEEKSLMVDTSWEQLE